MVATIMSQILRSPTDTKVNKTLQVNRDINNRAWGFKRAVVFAQKTPK